MATRPTPPDPIGAAVVEEHGPQGVTWQWRDPHDGSEQTARFIAPASRRAAGVAYGSIVFAIGGLTDARDLVADLALADRIVDPAGRLIHQPDRVILTVGDGTPFPFQAPPDWHPRIRALADHLQHGNGYLPDVLTALLAMDAAVRDGWSVGAYDHLVAAEQASGRR